MKISKEGWGKIFTGFRILTTISGIYLITQGDYVVGISGSMVGALLVYQNRNVIRDKSGE